MYIRKKINNFGKGAEDNFYPTIIFSDTKGESPKSRVYAPYVSTQYRLMTNGELECVNYAGQINGLSKMIVLFILT